LYLIQLGALLAVWLASYFSGLDVILSLLFMAVILIEGVNQTRSKLTLITVLLWQLPGIILSLAISTGISSAMPGGEYYIFVLELWYTPVIPLIALLSAPFLPAPAYYNMLLWLPLILCVCYLIGFYGRMRFPAKSFN
jgi:hypothetical protein